MAGYSGKDAGRKTMHERIRNLPAFIDLASGNMEEISSVYREIGLEMTGSVEKYFEWLPAFP